MPLMRRFLLACSGSPWLRRHAASHAFMRRAVKRFMPGESVEEALAAAGQLQSASIAAVLTYLGENVTAEGEAEKVARHYLEVLDRIRPSGLSAEISVKLTQLGLDFNPELCYAKLARIIERAGAGSVVWIDMEASPYVDSTLALYRRARSQYANVGVCLQAYLYRTAQDLESLRGIGGAVRLVKGAYQEKPEVALARKQEVDENFFRLARMLLETRDGAPGMRVALATHDAELIERLIGYADAHGLGKSKFEFQMLYGIQRGQQLRLARQGWGLRVLISYGSAWFPWYMRRLAERPANVWFVLRNLLG